MCNLERIKQKQTETCIDRLYREAYEKGRRDATRVVHRLWIPCTPKTMPHNYEKVLVTYQGCKPEYNGVVEMQYIHGLFMGDDDLYGRVDGGVVDSAAETLKVIAWMPLPAPYRPEGDDKHEG